jgi:hypothetical protein
METGLGLVTAMYQINEYRDEINLEHVGLSTVRCTMKLLKPVIRRVRRKKQGNRNPNSPWAKASLRWVTQLLVRLGWHTFNHSAEDNKLLGLTCTPACFDFQNGSGLTKSVIPMLESYSPQNNY